jgi:hypothetical protein
VCCMAREAGGQRCPQPASVACRSLAACRGRQLFFYKRAQIWAGDLYGCFRGQGLGHFRDVGELTTFAGRLGCKLMCTCLGSGCDCSHS